ncbi:MAG: YkoF family thiamine/hydroxymethylpyrimidine-binding protein [Cocleimonas sp.]
MKISVDISLYPLQEDYEAPIFSFIKGLEKNPEITVMKNQLSTQIYGDYHAIMSLLQDEMYEVFKEIPKSAMVLKFVGNDRSDIKVDW